MGIIKYIAISILLVLALIISKSYSRFVDNALNKSKGVYSFLLHIEHKLVGNMAPPREIAACYENECIAPMLEKIRNGSLMIDAYREISADIPEELDGLLVEYFADFGKGDLKLELMRVREIIGKIGGILDEYKNEGEKQKKVCNAALPSLAIGIIILLI